MPTSTAFPNPSTNAAGRSAFTAGVTGPGVTTANDSGIWRSGPLAKVFREGDAPPGAGSGVLLGDALTNPFAFNDQDEVVFLNLLTGRGVTGANDGSLWFASAAGTLSLIVREGGSLQVLPGDTRTVSSIFFDGGSGDEDGFPCGFNDRGQVVFRASFTDGSEGIFLATLIPEIRIKTIAKAGNTVTITLDSFTAYSFQLQRSPSLAPPAFMDLGSPQAGSTGSILTFTDPSAPSPTAFYKVVATGP